MRSSFLLATAAAALISVAPTPAQAEEASSLTLTIAAVETLSGNLQIALFKGGEAYEGGAPVAAHSVAANAANVSATFEGLAPGDYGVKLYHDANGNGELDTNPFGIPIEPFAFSNDAQGRFGPAKWDAAAFAITPGENSHTITLQ